MGRWLTVLVALVAQGMALMSPLCFVRCVGADGHECVELAGEGCERCEWQTCEPKSEVCAVPSCCQHCRADDSDHDAPVGVQMTAPDCSCRHLPLASAPQVQSRSLSADGLSQFHLFVPVPISKEVAASARVSDSANLWRSLLRTHESPQLALLATVVLRV